MTMPTETASAAPAPPPPPPPAPKCEALAENCRADEKTRAEIQASGVAFTPPNGWTYEKAAAYSRTVEPQGAAEVAFAIADSESDADIVKSVEQLAQAMQLQGIKLDKLKKRLKKPQTTLQGDSGEIELWEITASAQGGGAPPTLATRGSGTALLALARVATERLVVVLGFVVEPDEQGRAALIMQSVQSLSVAK